MAIAHVSSSGTTRVISGSFMDGELSVNTNVTPTGDNRFLWAHFTWIESAGDNFGDYGIVFDRITYDLVDMTFLAENFGSAVANIVYYMAGPPTGTRNLKAWFQDVSGFIIMTAALGFEVMSGVDQTTPIAQSGTATGSSGTVTKSLTTASTDNWLIDGATLFRGGSISVPTCQQTVRRNTLAGTLGSRHYEMISTKVATAASDTMSWTQTGSVPWATIVAELNVAAAAAAAPPHRTLLGVGT